jgi:hypothetical protein
MSTAAARAASRIVAPGSNSTWVPFRVKLGMVFRVYGQREERRKLRR